jgi:hypothetical protein
LKVVLVFNPESEGFKTGLGVLGALEHSDERRRPPDRAAGDATNLRSAAKVRPGLVWGGDGTLGSRTSARGDGTALNVASGTVNVFARVGIPGGIEAAIRFLREGEFPWASPGVSSCSRRESV